MVEIEQATGKFKYSMFSQNEHVSLYMLEIGKCQFTRHELNM